MRQRIALFLLMFIASVTTQAQVLQPVKWNFSIKSTGENTVEVIAEATIDNPWHLYSTTIPEGGPIATSINFEPSEAYTITGELKQSKDPKMVFDEAFQMELGYFSDKVTFTRDIEITGNGPITISGYVEFMACDDERCLPPDTIEFQLEVPKDAGNTAGADYWGIFLLALLGGLTALLTPCVFPMIPLTVSFFLRNADNKAKALRDGFFYGLTIIVAYVFLGLLISAIFGAGALNQLATSPVFNLIFFGILIFFAASFFGAYELTMPAKWSNKLDSKADQAGGLLGVVLMGLTFVLVSFSCTGPIVGTLLVEAATGGDLFSPAIGMLGFGIALAIPFTLFAIFPTAMKSLPKSGGWMNAVKVVLGFVVLAFSLKFLSIADSVGQWGILDREVFLVLWIAIFLLMGLYLIGKIKFSHDSDLPFLSVPRLFIAIGTFAFVMYLIPGLWGAPLKAIGAFLPSTETQDFDLSKQKVISTNTVSNTSDYKGSSIKEGVYGLMKYTDYEEGLQAAKEANKPVFLDFTGLGCANCKTMENNVWSDSRVQSILANDYILIALYVDDRTKLPVNEQYVSEETGRKIRTIGNKWSDFQISKYGNNSQPFYVLLNHNETPLTATRSFNTDVEAYIKWLEEGVTNFNK
ncbi:cytochrome c biogenesis protein CcdA [Geofilum sp. OHC36d9]|uniref:cytochrome c biogenesis protein CcdA n=1 Tax=Geofilum sp. OHC36d9 TaxID=3458413 RepID=UPI0040340825